MSAPIRFYPNLAFGKLELLASDGGLDFEIPSDLIDRPDVLRALLLLAEKGGTSFVDRGTPNLEDAVVDLATSEVTFEQGEDA